MVNQIVHFFPILFPVLTQQGANSLYLDPGSGSIIIQVLLAALLGGMYAIRVYWKKIKQLFKRSESSTTIVEDKKIDGE
jgi:hypothetical protein